MPPNMELVEWQLLAAVVYMILGRWLVGLRTRWQSAAFALLNVSAVYVFCFWRRDERFTALFNLLFLAYLALIAAQYLAMRLWSRRAGSLPWLAFFTPIGMLAAIRYAPIARISGSISASIHGVLQRHPEFTLGWVFIGFSYLAFRTSYLVLEVRNGVVPQPNFWEYLGFAFFAPTLSVGPINRYSQHHLAFAETNRPEIPAATALLRLLTGMVKYRFLGPLLNQLTYSGLLLDGHPHPWVDLPIAAVAYYLYLYCNFSGFCDMAIGCAGFMGVSVAGEFRPSLCRAEHEGFLEPLAHHALALHARRGFFPAVQGAGALLRPGVGEPRHRPDHRGGVSAGWHLAWHRLELRRLRRGTCARSSGQLLLRTLAAKMAW